MNVTAPTPAQPVTCADGAVDAQPAAGADGVVTGLTHPSMPRTTSAVPRRLELGASIAGTRRLRC